MEQFNIIMRDRTKVDFWGTMSEALNECGLMGGAYVTSILDENDEEMTEQLEIWG